MNPMNKFRGLHLAWNRTIIPSGSTADTIGTMTDARWKLAQHFYLARPFVARTHMLLKCKPLLPASRECLSTSIVPWSAICPYRYIHMDIVGHRLDVPEQRPFLPLAKALILTHIFKVIE